MKNEIRSIPYETISNRGLFIFGLKSYDSRMDK